MADSEISHHVFPKMSENVSKWDFLDKKKAQEATWIVTEKIHGANFCFICDGNTVRCAKRKAILQSEDRFFQFQRIQERYEEKVLDLFSQMQAKEEFKTLHLYGELFGGLYEHEEVRNLPQVKPIQKGIQYCPDLEFYAFDILLKSEDDSLRWVDYDEFCSNLSSLEFFHAKALFTGSLGECLEFNTRFQTTVPALLNLPDIDNNFAEGIVVKSSNNLEVIRKGKRTRAMVKIKTEEFREMAKRAESSKRKRTKADEAEEIFLSTMTKQRLINVLSKVGHLDQDNASQVIEDLVEDGRQEMDDMTGYKLWWALKPKERDDITSKAVECATFLVEEHMPNG